MHWHVGITLGYPCVKEVAESKDFTVAPAADDVTNMKKLGAGRLDVFVVEERSGLKALQESGQTNIEYDKTVPLSRPIRTAECRFGVLAWARHHAAAPFRRLVRH